MTDATHPITPPIELVQQWMTEERSQDYFCITEQVAHRAAQWGADQELEACCAWLPKLPPWSADDLRRHRRPKPPSLKEQALAALNEADQGLNESEWRQCSHTIRRALEAIPDD